MPITAKVVADSISPDGVRLTTLHLHYPRFILAEMNTHRAFSRNARSTRAVPTSKLIDEVMNDPVIPLKWGINKPGMASTEIADEETARLLEASWRAGAREAAYRAKHLFDTGLHKQWAGRVLEPYMWVDQLVSSTDWANFFELRDEVGAQPEIDELAKQIRIAMDESVPAQLNPGQWHLPYIEDYDYRDAALHLAQDSRSFTEDDVLECIKKISVARCARLTIKPFDGDGSIEKELKRYELLMVSRPVHASPAEHIATPDYAEDIEVGEDYLSQWANPHEHGNFYGWRQFRKQIPYNTIYDER